MELLTVKLTFFQYEISGNWNLKFETMNNEEMNRYRVMANPFIERALGQIISFDVRFD